MSSFEELAAARRSIRKYRPEMPPATMIEQMVQSASLAPSSSNRQPVRFFRITSPAIKAALQEALEEGRRKCLALAEDSRRPTQLRNWINAYYGYSEFMFRAPVLMAAGTTAHAPGFSRALAEAGIPRPPSAAQDDAHIALGLALQNFMLKGCELGLGTCILTAPLAFISCVVGPEEILGIKNAAIKCFVTVGYPAEAPPAPRRKDISVTFREI